MEDKCFKTHSELIEILKKRGMDFSDVDQEKKAISILEKENYYNVINGYKDLFLQKGTSTETYKNGTTFEEVYALYAFDRNIRHIYLKYLLKAESSFKTVIAHVFSDLYGHDNYLKITNFETQVNNVSDEDAIREITKLIGDIQQEIARQMKNHHPVVMHYMVNYGYIPLWVLVNVLTFGKITVFYKYMKKLIKKRLLESSDYKIKNFTNIWIYLALQEISVHTMNVFSILSSKKPSIPKAFKIFRF